MGEHLTPPRLYLLLGDNSSTLKRASPHGRPPSRAQTLSTLISSWLPSVAKGSIEIMMMLRISNHRALYCNVCHLNAGVYLFSVSQTLLRGV